MKKILLSTALLVSISSFGAELIKFRPMGKTCTVISCQDIETPVNSESWCSFDDSVAKIPLDPSYEVPMNRQSGKNVFDYSNGGHVAVIILDENETTGTYVDGYYWDKYYERYHLKLQCKY